VGCFTFGGALLMMMTLCGPMVFMPPSRIRVITVFFIGGYDAIRSLGASGIP